MSIAPEIFKELLAVAGAQCDEIVESDVAGQAVVNAIMQDAGPWIGQGGDVVRAFDHLVKKIAEKKLFPAREAGSEGDDRLLVLVDIGGYRTGLIKELQDKARAMAERAISFKYDVEMPPMTAYERLIVHTTLADMPGIKTESQGERHDRRVVIKYIA